MSEHYKVSTSQGDGADRLTVKAATKLGERILEAMFAAEHGTARSLTAAWRDGSLVVFVDDGAKAEAVEEES